MTKYSIDISKLAERDIWNSVSYIQEVLFQPESAKRIYRSIKEQISSLSTMPERYAVIAEEPYTSMVVRKICVENYLIFYIVNEKTKTVSIICVLYNRREWHNLI
ncbi:MAG: type II toxin-antitoxin system RelE/ParE family toxin [Clostridia bacterium]|nr:type II toxin-antitoxin system RelE/ParE family toxin [Clostridia bacterium]